MHVSCACVHLFGGGGGGTLQWKSRPQHPGREGGGGRGGIWQENGARSRGVKGGSAGGWRGQAERVGTVTIG